MFRFDRYLLGQLMTIFGFFALVLVGVYWVNRGVRLFDTLIADGQSAWVFLEFTALTLPTVIRLMLPVAAFIATLYVANRMSAESELTVVQATGYSPMRLSRGAAAFGLVVGAMTAVIANFLEPLAAGQLADRRGELAADLSSRFLTEGSFVHPTRGITFFIGDITAQGELRDVFLNDTRDPRRMTTYAAGRAALVRGETGPKIVMFDGKAQMLERSTGRLSVTRFSDFAYDVGAAIDKGGARRLTLNEVPTRSLLFPPPGLADELAVTPAAIAYEAHDRLAQGFNPLALVLLAFALMLSGGFSRFGMWRQIAIAVAGAILFNVATTLAGSIAAERAGAWPVVYLPFAVTLAAAGWLLYRAGRPRRATGLRHARPAAGGAA
ncbi:MAG: LPS export ABC transporter permease LptF [Rhodobacteraceae bacterium]|nr:LPS export ABC transporter permease LptF [Paracoccaceae bacterium]